jgi:hypothetical protein
MPVIIDTVIFHRDFGDLHSNSIDEPYYRSAVLQHEYDKEAYVFSVPFDAGNQSFLFIRVPSRCAQIISSMTGRMFSQAQHLNY